ncbi:MAG: hypothetical protein E2590_02520 [Chryseobacterium sp.]|uniref:hypothetical protein n=1 Tax=Epilithonimonas caeni TaxID=365343 RepID=UPI00041DF393|nr:hypothetical protein [Epilithonimonas caeni]MPS72002.1 hypothetical protein [Chryseobacterium sp.]MPT32144.1 hypothetical protein [Chryseobacterium sp.]
MELDKFISETIQAIIKSINDTSEYAEKNGAIINPIFLESDDDYDYKTTIWRKDKQDGRRALTKLDFDIAVTVSNENNNKIGGGIKVQVLNLGASTSDKDSNQTSSRIKFSLNVAFPHQGTN